MSPAAAARKPHDAWVTDQLAEFLAAISGSESENAALIGGVERAAEAFEAEAGAILVETGIEASTGFGGRHEDHAPVLLEVAHGRASSLEVSGVGRCAAIAVPVDDDRARHLVIARRSDEGFTADEAGLLRGMARVLALTVRMLRTIEAERSLRAQSERQGHENMRRLASLRERERLLARLSRIQRSIVSRTSLEEVLDGIVQGAGELLGDEVAVLRLIDEEDASMMVIVAAEGVPLGTLAEAERRPVSEGVGGRAITEGRLIVVEDYQGSEGTNPLFVADGVRAAMAAPVHEHGEVVGSLVVATHGQGRAYSKTEREMLLSFAEHASLALSDAKTIHDAIHQAFHDSLTRLPNRALFVDRLRHALTRAARGSSEVAVLFLDLDTFKTVNDSLGHAAGDELLIAVAGRISETVRAGDTAARFAGDEFVVLLEDVERSEVSRAAERIHEALEAPFSVQGREVFVSASIGIAVGGDEAEDLLRNADLALYRAKTRGKGQYEVFEPEMHTEVVERLELEGDLQRAVKGNEFVLDYQPIIKLRTGEVAGVEALVRWRHPRRGLLMPADFVPLAEDTRAILAIGRWVLNQACRQASHWRRQHLEHAALAVSVNISPVQLAETDLVAEVADALETSGLDPRSLILELTETAFMEDTDEIADRLWDLKRLGVQLAVDDFGTGYSSLQHLRRFPIDVLKIAKSFVDGICGASDESGLARAIIDLGGSFQLRVVADGIEHAEQLGRLRDLGCDLGQGYYFAGPMPAGKLGLLLAGATVDSAGI